MVSTGQNFKNLFCVAVIVLILLVNFSYSQVRDVKILKTGWRFYQGENESAFQAEFDDSQWQEVRVPHDWAIAGPFILDGDASTGKLPWKAQGWYRTKINIDKNGKRRRFYLLFDGIMAFPKVYFNGRLAGQWDYGYNSFYLDITDYTRDGENVLAIHVDTRKHESRWYPGGGIFRKVRLIAVNPIHTEIWGTQVTTPILKPHYADVRIVSTVRNGGRSDAQIKVVQNIIVAENILIARGELTESVHAGNREMFETTLTIANPRRWDLDDPYLYTVETNVYNENDLVDTYRTTFGVRDIRFTADYGLYINDRRVQLKGVNLHHDQGPLGAAFNARAMQRQLEIMKGMGCNAIRTSHNVPAPELLDLCDQMGLLVFNEAFDKYDEKADITDTTDFDAYAHRNIRNFIKRDRNHPSVFIWSAGNEMWDVEANENNGFQRLRTMLNYIRKYDYTRPATIACGDKESIPLRHFDYYDVHSWNYQRRYALARQLEPNKAVIISESASTVSTRGFYEFPLPEKPTDFTKYLQVSSYDLNAPEWADLADDDFMWQQEEPYIVGEFVWTGFDYIGEPTPYSNSMVKEQGMSDSDASRSSYFGIVDLCGIPKDRYYLYKSYWQPQETTIHILPHWNWPGRIGKNVPVFVYTNGDCAELFLNGKSLGKKCKNPKSEKSYKRFRLMWEDVVYEPGELKVVAYKAGLQIGEISRKTTGQPHRLHLTPDRSLIKADGDDLSYILVEALDEEGYLCPLANNKVHIKIDGTGEIAGVGNGNPQSFAPFQAKYVYLFNGQAMIIVRADETPGTIKVEAFTENLTPASVTISVK